MTPEIGGTQPMFGNNNSDDDDAQSFRENVQRFAYNVFNVGEDPDEGESEDEPDDEEPQGTIPSASLRHGQPSSVRKWSLGDHTMATQFEGENIRQRINELQGVDDDLADILGEAASMVEGRSISGFECPVCGLNHGHSDRKHDVRSAFNVTSTFADEMPYSPYCHCGVNWLAKTLHLIPYVNQPVFTDEDSFEPFLSGADFQQFTDAIEALQDGESDEEEEVTVEDALHEADLPDNEDMVRSLDLFYTRWTDITSASESAPIADETVNEMDEMVADIETRISHERNNDDEDTYDFEDEGELGTITFLNRTGTYGFIETDEADHEVFFHNDQTEFLNVAFDDLAEGIEVLVEVEMREKGPFAARVEVTE